MSKSINQIVLIGISPFLLFFIVHFTMPPIGYEKLPGNLIQKNQQNISNYTTIVSDENCISAVCWYLKRNDVYLLMGGGELDYGLGYSDVSGRLIDLESAADLINRKNGKIIIIARTRNILRWKDQLPNPRFQDSSGPEGYTLWRY